MKLTLDATVTICSDWPSIHPSILSQYLLLSTLPHSCSLTRSLTRRSQDCGTTTGRFYIFDEQANVVASHQKEFKQVYPKQGWMEEEPDDLVESCLECIEKAVEMLEEKGDYKVGDIKGMGITNQRGE